MANERANPYPPGAIIDIVGTGHGGNGRSCAKHEACGLDLQLESVVRIREIKIIDGTSFFLMSLTHCLHFFK